jgi:hypothetical protein
MMLMMTMMMVLLMMMMKMTTLMILTMMITIKIKVMIFLSIGLKTTGAVNYRLFVLRVREGPLPKPGRDCSCRDHEELQ